MVCTTNGLTKKLACRFDDEKLDILFDSSSNDTSQTLIDTSNVILKFELNRFAPLLLLHRDGWPDDVPDITEAFSMTDLQLQYLFLENNVRATA
jgi:hypothetical protein